MSNERASKIRIGHRFEINDVLAVHIPGPKSTR